MLADPVTDLHWPTFIRPAKLKLLQAKWQNNRWEQEHPIMNYKIVIILIEHSECFHCLQYLPEARRVDSHPWRGKSCWLMPPQVKKILWKFLFPHCPPNPRASWLLSYLSLNMSTMEFLLWFIAGLGLLTFSFLSIDFDFLLHLHCRWIKWQCKSCKLQPAKQKCLILYSNQTLKYNCLAYCPCTNLTHVLRDAMRNVETTHKSAKRSGTIGLGVVV